MDKQEAKLILQSYRPNGRDAGDPAFKEALAMAQTDPELREWFEHEQTLDQAISGKLRESGVPADLKSAILAGMRGDSKLVRPSHSWWKSPALAWAAAIVLVFAAAVLLRSPYSDGDSAALADYRLTMRSHLETFEGFDVQDDSPASIREWLANQHQFGSVKIPDQLAGKRSIGCKLFPYGDSQSALICFQLPNMETVHLFVIEKGAIQGMSPGEQAVFKKCGDWDTCSWESDDNLYLLLGKVGNDTLKALNRR